MVVGTLAETGTTLPLDGVVDMILNSNHGIARGDFVMTPRDLGTITSLRLVAFTFRLGDRHSEHLAYTSMAVPLEGVQEPGPDGVLERSCAGLEFGHACVGVRAQDIFVVESAQLTGCEQFCASLEGVGCCQFDASKSQCLAQMGGHLVQDTDLPIAAVLCVARSPNTTAATATTPVSSDGSSAKQSMSSMSASAVAMILCALVVLIVVAVAMARGATANPGVHVSIHDDGKAVSIAPGSTVPAESAPPSVPPSAYTVTMRRPQCDPQLREREMWDRDDISASMATSAAPPPPFNPQTIFDKIMDGKRPIEEGYTNKRAALQPQVTMQEKPAEDEYRQVVKRPSATVADEPIYEAAAATSLISSILQQSRDMLTLTRSNRDVSDNGGSKTRDDGDGDAIEEPLYETATSMLHARDNTNSSNQTDLQALSERATSPPAALDPGRETRGKGGDGTFCGTLRRPVIADDDSDDMYDALCVDFADFQDVQELNRWG